MLSTSTQHRSILGESWLSSARIGGKLHEFGPTLANTCRSSADSGHLLGPKFGQIRRKFCRFGLKVADSG